MSITLDKRNLTIPQKGLVLHLDAGDARSYSGTGSIWYDISGGNNHFNIVSTAFNSSGVKYMDFNGSYGCAKRSPDIIVGNGVTNEVTYIVWTRIKNSNAEFKTLTRSLSVGIDHQVGIPVSWKIGMFDNNNGSGFNDSGFSQQNLPSYGTSNWDMLVFRFNTTSPYFTVSYNDTPETIRGANTSINSSFKYGFCSIGAYHGESSNPASSSSQYWGDIGLFAVYNRVLTNAEILQCYNAGAPRFKGAAQQYEDYVEFNDGSTQTTSYNSSVDIGKSISTSVYNSVGTFTWTKPTGCNRVLVKVVGGGGGGAGHCESGGGGGYAEKIIDVSSVSTVSVTVGGGGAAIAYYNAAGNGGTSSFGSYCSATGGSGANQHVAHTGGHGGVGSGGNANFLGGSGTGHSNNGGQQSVGVGGSSYWGSGNKAGYYNNNPSNTARTTAPGSGGAGANQGYYYQNGVAGMVVVYAFQ